MNTFMLIKSNCWQPKINLCGKKSEREKQGYSNNFYMKDDEKLDYDTGSRVNEDGKNIKDIYSALSVHPCFSCIFPFDSQTSLLIYQFKIMIEIITSIY